MTNITKNDLTENEIKNRKAIFHTSEVGDLSSTIVENRAITAERRPTNVKRVGKAVLAVTTALSVGALVGSLSGKGEDTPTQSGGVVRIEGGAAGVQGEHMQIDRENLNPGQKQSVYIQEHNGELPPSAP